jgi:hypothetical protein
MKIMQICVQLNGGDTQRNAFYQGAGNDSLK